MTVKGNIPFNCKIWIENFDSKEVRSYLRKLYHSNLCAFTELLAKPEYKLRNLCQWDRI